MPPIRARAPLDLDLEDHLIFGLTPVRFGYLAIGALAAYALAGHAPGPLGLPLACALLACAAAFAWLRWHGRPLDAWLLDVAVHAHRNLEIDIDPVLLRRIRAPLRSERLRTIGVAGAEPGVGATTVAVELGAALALKGRRVSLQPPLGTPVRTARLNLDGAGTHAASGLRVARRPRADDECVIFDLGARPRGRTDLGLVVVGADGVEGAPARLRARHLDQVAIPRDPAVPAAQALGEPVILQFPASRAASAVRRLADAVDPSRPGPWQQEPSDVPPAG